MILKLLGCWLVSFFFWPFTYTLVQSFSLTSSQAHFNSNLLYEYLSSPHETFKQTYTSQTSICNSHTSSSPPWPPSSLHRMELSRQLVPLQVPVSLSLQLPLSLAPLLNQWSLPVSSLSLLSVLLFCEAGYH